MAAAVLFVACGPAPPSPEHQTLTNFFEASRVRDTTVLARTASVVFEPRRDGVVQEFRVVDRGPETSPKPVTVRARVRTPTGQVVERTLVVTMQRGPGPYPWFITAVTPPPASRTSPAASSAPPS